MTRPPSTTRTPRGGFCGCAWSRGTCPPCWRCSTLFGFLKDVCTGDCPSAPFGVDFYIYPIVFGGIGAAVAAALLGPLVSLLKGWYLSFWPALAIGLVLLASVAGSALTDFSSTYWHSNPDAVDVGG
jgi:hypothetical protein